MPGCPPSSSRRRCTIATYDGPWILSRVIADRAHRLGDRIAVIAPDETATLTYADLADGAARAASGLVALGVAPGDRVATMLPPSVPYLRAWLGAAWAGAVDVPVNTAYKGYFLEKVINETGARVVVVDDAWLDEVLAADLPDVEHIIPVRGVGDGADPRVRDPDVLTGADPIAPVDREETDPLYIIYTSGTSGSSRGALHSNRSALHNVAGPVSRLDLQPDDIAYSFFPLFHVTARSFVLGSTFWTGGTAVLRPKFSVTRFWDDVVDHRVTWFTAMGAVMTILLSQDPSPAERQHAVRLVCAGSVPVPLGTAFVERFGVELLDIYGTTELGTVTCPRPGEWIPGTTGPAMDHFEVEVHDDDDRPVPPGTVGEIVVRPRHPEAMFRGYWGQPEATLAAIRNLWYHTGDAGVLDADGNLSFVDRKKDVIRRRGENISSGEIEALLARHPAVLECAVYGVPSDLTEEEVMVAVVPKSDLAPQELLAWAQAQLPDFAVPRFVRMVDALPKTPSERVQKYRLREAGVTADTYDRAAAP